MAFHAPLGLDPVCRAQLTTPQSVTANPSEDQSDSSAVQGDSKLPSGPAPKDGPQSQYYRRGTLLNLRKLPENVLLDQKTLWTSPWRVRLGDAQWLVPIAGVSTGLMVTDRPASYEASRRHQHLSSQVSNAGIGLLGLTAGSMYLLGVRTGDLHKRETGLLSAEAGVDALAVDEVLKYGFARGRPNQNAGSGRFFQWGGDSFPSAHATTAFAMATVIANEYPGWMTKLLAYGTATGIGLARVGAQQHFPSDVFIGGTMGYLIGRSVYRRRHDPAVDSYGTFGSELVPLPATRMSSTYIELDSWIYPAIERLAALGIAKTEFLGLRPWTRMAVYGMLAGVDESNLDSPAETLVSSLKAELKREEELDSGRPNKGISVDRIYSRTQFISGTPLNDSYHFGQTIADDFGRPYARGAQQINGFENRAENGPFSFFVRGEYQHSPGVAGYSASVAQVIAKQDNIPVQTYSGLPSRDAFRLLDTYVSTNVLGHEVSVGKQSYWWGPGSGSAMMLSDNVEPFYSLRINRTLPLHVPLLSKVLGPFRYDSFFGKLSGHHFPRQPFFYGQKVSFRPTDNLELGFSRDAVIAGEGIAPLTFGNFFHSFTSTSSGTYPGFSLRRSPGARHANFDFSYRLPGLRNWLTLYADSVVHDDVSPVDAPRRAAVSPGVYVTRFPFIPKLDLHVEGGTTDTVTSRAEGGKFYYWEGIYRDAYTNKGNLLGSWLGREGTGGQAWATYWFNPQRTLRVGYRTVKTSQYFVPNGETQQDAYAELRYGWQNGLALQVFLQAERWRAPVLAATPQTDMTAQIQLSFSPKDWRLVKH
ncbi:MAG TPA: capsule assembly Wzi family protein [Terriglobales bacterium]|nr:capsule assembly Wzi family protein [Terriglobales bacterium]